MIGKSKFDAFGKIHELRMLFKGKNSSLAIKINEVCDSTDVLMTFCDEKEREDIVKQLQVDLKEYVKKLKEKHESQGH